MNYEEKYKEALERARALRQEAIDKEYVIDYVKDYETIFPELAESEDERIREEIIECIETLIKAPGANPRLCDWLAWLEKQKEQKPSEWNEDFDKEVESVHKRYPEVSFAKLTRIAYHFAKWADKYENTEWSEKEERLINTSISFLKDFADKGYENAVECIDWLKSKLNGDTCK